jgi:hypothetical protein
LHYRTTEPSEASEENEESETTTVEIAEMTAATTVDVPEALEEERREAEVREEEEVREAEDTAADVTSRISTPPVVVEPRGIERTDATVAGIEIEDQGEGLEKTIGDVTEVTLAMIDAVEAAETGMHMEAVMEAVVKRESAALLHL